MAGNLKRDITEFATAIYRHTALVVGGGLFAISAFVWGMIQWVSPGALTLPTPYWWLLWGITVSLLFSAAFLAWRDQFHQNAALTEQALTKRPRILPTRIETDRDIELWTFLYIVNDSDEPAFDVMMSPVVVDESSLEFNAELARVSRSDGEVQLKLSLLGFPVGQTLSDRTWITAKQLSAIMAEANRQSMEFAFYYKDFSGQWYKSVCLLRSVFSPIGLHASFLRHELATDPRACKT